jgi:hypothetical protein
VTVPVGLYAPLSVAVSVADPPMMIDAGLTTVVTVGVALATVRVSPAAPHEVVTATLFASPL